VNAVLCADEDATLVTAFFGVFDRVRGTLRYGIAGHPPPLLVSPAGTAAPFEGSGVVLGLDARSQYDDFIMPLDAGYGAVFYTDGIIEVERDYFKGMRDLERAVLDELAAPSANVADGIQRRIFAHAEPRDDSALLFVGVLSLVTGADAPTVWQFDARDAVAARLVKRALTWRIGGVTDDADGISAVMLAYGELIGNVARHTPGRARVVLESDGTSRVIHVEDEGTPFAFNGDAAPDAFAESGRGLFIARRVADVRLSRTPRGNRVSIAVPGGTAAS
jgi:anti-sigma regulatory factor (Ser/Thr protein kinase)